MGWRGVVFLSLALVRFILFMLHTFPPPPPFAPAQTVSILYITQITERLYTYAHRYVLSFGVIFKMAEFQSQGAYAVSSCRDFHCSVVSKSCPDYLLYCFVLAKWDGSSFFRKRRMKIEHLIHCHLESFVTLRMSEPNAVVYRPKKR